MPAGRKRHEDRLDILLLRVGDQPMDDHAQVRRFLDKYVLLAVDGLLSRLAGEKLAKARPQRHEDVLERGEGGRRLVALELRDESLGKLATVGQLLLGQVIAQA